MVYGKFGLVTRSWRWRVLFLVVRELPVGLSECRSFVDTTMERRECRHAAACRGKWKLSVSIFKSWTVLLSLSLYTATVASGNRLRASFEDVPVRPSITHDWGQRYRIGHMDAKAQQLDIARLSPTVVSLSRQLKEKWATRGQMPALTELGLTNCSDITALHIVRPSSLPQQDGAHRFSLTFQPRHLNEFTTIKNVLLRVEVAFNVSKVASSLSARCSDGGKNNLSQPLCIAAKATVLLDGIEATKSSPFGGIRRLLDCSNVSNGAFGAVREVFTFNVTELLPKLTDVTANDDLTFEFKAHLDKENCHHLNLKHQHWNVTRGSDSLLLYVRGHPVTGLLSCSGVPLSRVQRRPSTSPGCPGQDCYRQPWRINIGSMTYFVSPLILLEASATNIDLGVCNGSCEYISTSTTCSDVQHRAQLCYRNSCALNILGECKETACVLKPMCALSSDALQGRWIVYAIKADGGIASTDSSPTPYADSGMIYFETLVIPNSGGCECR